MNLVLSRVITLTLLLVLGASAETGATFTSLGILTGASSDVARGGRLSSGARIMSAAMIV